MSELDTSDLLTVAQAIAILDAVPVAGRVEEVSIHDARGRRLAQEVFADRDAPPFDKSLMDGYAVRGEQARGPMPITLRVLGELAAGAEPSPSMNVEPGAAIAVMTGAPMPAGADTVVPVEQTLAIEEIDGQPTVTIAKPTPARNVSARGSDCRAGDRLLTVGTILGPAQIAVAASVGTHRLSVFCRPTVAVLTTGDEIVSIDSAPGPSQIRNSNGPMLASLVASMGGEVIFRDVARDIPSLIRAAIDRTLRADVVLISGGMSMGTHDYVPKILREIGVNVKISKLKIKPGKPFLFGTYEHPAVSPSASARVESRAAGRVDASGGAQGDTSSGAAEGTANDAPPSDAPHIDPPKKPGRMTYIFGLPGNPVSSFVCTVRLVSRLMARLTGASNDKAGLPRERWLAGKLDAGLLVNGPREFYQPCIWTPAAGRSSASNEFAAITPLNWKGSADIFTLAKANALLVRSANEPPSPKGTLVRVLEIPV